jgi:hypothetical protein
MRLWQLGGVTRWPMKLLDARFEIELACGLRRASSRFESHRSSGQTNQRFRRQSQFHDRPSLLVGAKDGCADLRILCYVPELIVLVRRRRRQIEDVNGFRSIRPLPEMPQPLESGHDRSAGQGRRVFRESGCEGPVVRAGDRRMRRLPRRWFRRQETPGEHGEGQEGRRHGAQDGR